MKPWIRTAVATAALTFLAGCTSETSAAPTPNAEASETTQLTLQTAPDCNGCIADIEGILGKLEGFGSVDATPNEAQITVHHTAGLSQDAITAALAAGGRPVQQ